VRTRLTGGPDLAGATMSEHASERPERRRLDRITADGYLDDLGELDLEAVRARRDECAAEETQLSYLRRMLQARLDIVVAEQQRRRDGGEAHSLVEALPGLLADTPPGSAREARAMRIEPPEGQMRRQEDRLAVDGTLARLPDLSDEELDGVVEQLRGEESRVSSVRSVVQQRLDELQEALVARYRGEGGADAGA
jgi:hypothetical protein